MLQFSLKLAWDMCSLNNPCQQNGYCNFNQNIGDEICDCTSSGWLGQLKNYSKFIFQK